MMYLKEDAVRRRRFLIMAAASLMLVAAVICVAGGAPRSESLSIHPKIGMKNSAKVTRTWHALVMSQACKGAANPHKCVGTIAGLPGWPNADAKQLLHEAVQSSIVLVEKTSDKALSLWQGANVGIERTALQDCIELLSDTTDALTDVMSSVFAIGTNTSSKLDASDVRTFLSAAMTNQETCREGLDSTSGLVKSRLQIQADRISDRISTCLAMAKRIDDLRIGYTIPSHNRRLLSESDVEDKSDDFPTWLSAANRRLLQADPSVIEVDAVVAQDGTGNYTTITQAVNAAPQNSDRRYIIHVKAGVYHEIVEIKKKKTNIMMIGDGMDRTIVTGNLSVLAGTTTFRSATFAVKSEGFIARDMGFENTAGMEGQAVALRVGAHRSLFYRCSMKGYQDTLYAYSYVQFYSECRIYGSVDFIFGNAVAVFQSCDLIPRKRMEGQMVVITAHGRKESNENTGFSMHDCRITVEPDLVPLKASVPTYLGRPWKQYARTVFMESYLDDIIKPQGWLPWNASNFGSDTCYYGEFMNYGPGANLSERVKWPGYHQMTIPDATMFTVRRFIKGNRWLPTTGVPYMPDLKAHVPH